ncbi:MAG: hypothetical protein GX550_00530 [Syntrophomonadaceae bacterium]|nr:hypothetical protein [Syntrophomonadaceae bacterium]
MNREIKITFNNRLLRSYIEVDLCLDCPRQDSKGCCGHYSPVFYPTDLAYLYKENPDILSLILNLKDITVLDTSITVNNDIDGQSYKCKFHNQTKGCILAQEMRESICRHFVCPGIDWESEPKCNNWRIFFDSLTEYEIALNKRLGDKLAQKNLTLRDRSRHNAFFKELISLYDEETENFPSFLYNFPSTEEYTLIRPIKYGRDWPL